MSWTKLEYASHKRPPQELKKLQPAQNGIKGKEETHRLWYLIASWEMKHSDWFI